jgi:hypothetical protein
MNRFRDFQLTGASSLLLHRSAAGARAGLM